MSFPWFGFQRALDLGLRCQWEGLPPEVFMALILDEEAMRGVSGVARYGVEFSEE